jgi:hypothetical protein
LDAATANLVERIAQAPTVGYAAHAAAASDGFPPAFEVEHFVRAARDALMRGVLEPY